MDVRGFDAQHGLFVARRYYRYCSSCRSGRGKVHCKGLLGLTMTKSRMERVGRTVGDHWGQAGMFEAGNLVVKEHLLVEV